MEPLGEPLMIQPNLLSVAADHQIACAFTFPFTLKTLLCRYSMVPVITYSRAAQSGACGLLFSQPQGLV